MKHLSRALLRILGVLAPTALASCLVQPDYGAPVRYGVSGKVIVRKNGVGIPGIQLTCLKADYEPFVAAFSEKDGRFDVSGECDQLQADDVDGAENGGPYQSATVDVARHEEDVLIKMEEQGS